MCLYKVHRQRENKQDIKRQTIWINCFVGLCINHFYILFILTKKLRLDDGVHEDIKKSNLCFMIKWVLEVILEMFEKSLRDNLI